MHEYLCSYSFGYSTCHGSPCISPLEELHFSVFCFFLGSLCHLYFIGLHIVLVAVNLTLEPRDGVTIEEQDTNIEFLNIN